MIRMSAMIVFSLILINILFPIGSAQVLDINLERFTCGLQRQTVCLFTEVFEDDPFYEQLMKRDERCAQKRRLKPDNTLIYRFGTLQIRTSAITPYRYTAHFQMTHNCTTNSEIRCVSWTNHLWMGGGDTIVNPWYKDEKLTDRGTKGPCSERWEGGIMSDWYQKEEEEGSGSGTMIN